MANIKKFNNPATITIQIETDVKKAVMAQGNMTQYANDAIIEKLARDGVKWRTE